MKMVVRIKIVCLFVEWKTSYKLRYSFTAREQYEVYGCVLLPQELLLR